MKIFSIAVGENGEIKMAGDLELTQVKQLIEAILIQQAFEEGRKKALEEKEVTCHSKKENLK